MAIYVLFQCCKCFGNIRLHLYSSSSNKNNISVQLCRHFDIIYSYKCNWGFFTLGWNIILDLRVKCRKCKQNYFNFGSTTFNADYYEFNSHHICCYNVFILSVSGYNFSNNEKGYLLQKEQQKLNEKIKKGQNNEKKENLSYTKDLNMKNNFQKKETEKKRKKISCNTNYIEKDLTHLSHNLNYQFQNELSLDIEEKINETVNFSICKSVE